MAVKALEYEKKWTSPTDFPTYEPDEEQVRADLQYHPDAIASYLNEVMRPVLDTADDNGAKAKEHLADVGIHVTAAEKAAWNGKIAVQSTAPSDEKALWIDTGENGTAKYYNGQAWVATAAVSATVATAVPVLPEDPQSTVLGQIWVVE